MDRRQRATGKELGSEQAIASVEEDNAALVVQGNFAGADAEGLGAVIQELVRNGMLQFPDFKAQVGVRNWQE